MVTERQLRELALRRELLLTRSRLERASLQLQCEDLAASLRWVDAGWRAASTAKRLAPVALPAALLFLGRGKWSWYSAARLGWRAWNLARVWWRG